MNQSSQPVSSGHIVKADLPIIPAATLRGPSERFLEALQERVYGAIGLTAADCQHREWVGQQTILPLRLQQKAEQLSPAEFARYRTAVLEALTRDELMPRPTAFERPHQYSILRDLTSAIEGAASGLSIELPFKPVVGTLPTRLLEPLMVRVPDTSEVVVLIDGSLLTYVHLLAKTIAHALPCAMVENDSFLQHLPAPGWEQAIDPDGEATERFVELMLAAMNGNAASAPTYAPDSVCEQTIAALCECMELFIVAREYARLCEGDFLTAGTELRQAHGQSFEALVWTARQEMHADALGIGLMLSAADAKGESPRMAFWSADLLLASYGIIDRALTFIENPTMLSSVYAPVTIFDERRARLRDLMCQLEGGERAAHLAAALDPVIKTLGDRFEIVLHEMRYGPQPTH
jgi:hypothetical protein